MSLLLAWLVFPLVLLVLAIGCGLLVERLGGATIDGALLAPIGFAAVIVIAGLFTTTSATAPFAAPACVAAAIAGLVAGRTRLGRPCGWAAVAALGVFLAYAAPVLFSGKATFAGYIKLDDTATWAAMTDRLMTNGRSIGGLAPSTYQATLNFSLGQGYPVGSLLPWGVGRVLVGQDLLWVVQPYLAFCAAMLALTIWWLVRGLIRLPWAAAGAAFVAAQPALLFGYSLWGGVKELSGAACIAVAAAVVPTAVASPSRARRVLPLAVAAAATLSVFSLGAVIWLAAALAGGLALLAASRPPLRAAVVPAVSFTALAALLALPVLRTASYILNTSGGLTKQAGGSPAAAAAARGEALGNLVHPLSVLQVAGVWPTGDFRFHPDARAVTDALIAVVLLAAAVGLVVAWRRQAWALVCYVATAGFGCYLIVLFGSPWVDAKALAIASPIVLAAAAVGAAAACERSRPAGAALALVVAGGVVWSNVLAYGAVYLGPRDQLHELQQIGRRIAGQGPTLMTEYQPYGARHLLRKADAEGASELRIRAVSLLDGSTLPRGAYADTDAFALGSLAPYRTLVLRRSPTQSRPPSDYSLTYSGRWYDVWQRTGPGSQIVGHLGLGTSLEPAAPAPCKRVMRVAASAGGRGRLAAVRRGHVIVFELSATRHPASWSDPAGSDLLPASAGSARGTLYTAAPGRYTVWVGGSFRSRLDVLVDGREVGHMRAQLNVTGQWSDFGGARLAAGPHAIELRYAGPDLAPGSAGAPVPLGPLAFTREADEPAVFYLPARAARSLCGKPLDWIEALRP